jgi:hypothetical protein
MKKTIFLTIIMTLFMAACRGSVETTQSENDTDAPQSSVNGEGFDIGSQELPQSSALAIGTLKLEGTDQAVAPDQAADLLPLWQVLNSLTTSDTAAQGEIDAVIGQIQDTMTAEQLAAIETMELTGEDLFATMQELGLTTGPQVNAEGTPQAGSGFGNGQGPGGGLPGGGAPGGGPGGGFGGGEVSPEQMATAQARRAENGGPGFGNRMMTPLVEAVIELLEAKVK